MGLQEIVLLSFSVTFYLKKEECLSMYVNVYLFCIFIRISCIKSAILIIVHYFVQIKLFGFFFKSPQNFVPLKSMVVEKFSLAFN